MHRYILACDRHGKKRNNWRPSKNQTKKHAKSRRCDCQTEVHLRLIFPGTLQVEHNGRQHILNHKPTKKPSFHPTRWRRQRKEAVLGFIRGDAIQGERAAATMITLRREFPRILVKRRDLCNERQRTRTTALGGKTKMEHFLAVIGDTNKYFSDHCRDAGGQLTAMFIANLKTIRSSRRTVT